MGISTVWLPLKKKKKKKEKRKKKLLYDPVIPLLDTYPKELKSASQRDPLCIIELFTVVTRSNSSCSSVEEQTVVFIPWDLIQLLKKEVILTHLPAGKTHQDLVLREISQSQKDKILYECIYMRDIE